LIMSVPDGQFPSQSAFLVQQGNVEVGRYVGFNFGPNIVLTDEGSELGVDAVSGGGGVASVTATAPLASSGGANPNLTITAATTLAAGSMSAADKSKLNGLNFATVTARLVDDQEGTLLGAAQTVLLGGSGSLSFTWVLDGLADDSHDVSIEVKVSAGTLHVRPATQPDSEGASIAVNNPGIGHVSANLAVDFSTASAVFVNLLTTPGITPVPGSSLIYGASVNFTLSP
jgi:hypothetical protein